MNAPSAIHRKLFVGPALLAASVGLALAVSSGCVTEADRSVGQAFCPKRTIVKDDTTGAIITDSFRPVSQVLERRCGTIDCHGTAARPMRIYSQSGLRRPEPSDSEIVKTGEYYTGGLEATTDAEAEDNYLAACGLEPEKMDKVVGGQADPSELTLVRKPRLEEKHKGGRIWASGSTAGDRCITSWIIGAVDTQACDDELAKP